MGLYFASTAIDYLSKLPKIKEADSKSLVGEVFCRYISKFLPPCSSRWQRGVQVPNARVNIKRG